MHSIMKFLINNGIQFTTLEVSDGLFYSFEINGIRYSAENMRRKYQLNVYRQGSDFFRPIVCKTQRELIEELTRLAY